MSATTKASRLALLGLTTALLSLAPAAAHAHQAADAGSQCGLQRVGTEYIRCDNLTGAGVIAATWAHEPPRSCALQRLGTELVKCDNLTGGAAELPPLPRDPNGCVLLQLGTELVRCDNLTGSHSWTNPRSAVG